MAKSNLGGIVVRPTNDDPNHPFENVIHSDWRVFWRTVADNYPCSYECIFDLCQEKTVRGFYYLPPPYQQNGRIIDWELCTGTSLSNCDQSIASGSFTKHFSAYWPDEDERFGFVSIIPFTCRFVKLIAKTTNGMCLAAASLTIVTDLYECETLSYASLAHLKGSKMAPSVHLKYEMAPCQLVYGEMTIRQSSPGSYFMAIGFTGGYFGMQELVEEKRKVIIFSVWDSNDLDDPNSLEEELQVQLVHSHPYVRVGRFGGEGTGGQSFYDFNWQLNDTYRFAVRADDFSHERVAYAAYFFNPIEKQWINLATFATKRASSESLIKNVYSFIEDFRRDFDSFNEERTAEFGNFWGCNLHSHWQACNIAQFTCDSNPNRNIGCECSEDSWILTTGGSIRNSPVQLKDSAALRQFSRNIPPADIYSIFEP